MEIENIKVLQNKVVTIIDKNLISDIKKLNTSCIPRRLFNISINDDIGFTTRDYDKEKLNELLDLFGLDNEILYRSYREISKSEYNKICIIICLLDNKPILLLENPTDGLDIKSKKSLIKILKREKRNNKIIFVTSTDSEFLFSVSNVIIYRDKNKYVINDNKYNFFGNKRLLKDLDIEQPNIMNFYDEVKKNKKVRLLNRDNINDLIKEIYRHAK